MNIIYYEDDDILFIEFSKDKVVRDFPELERQCRLYREGYWRNHHSGCQESRLLSG